MTQDGSPTAGSHEIPPAVSPPVESAGAPGEAAGPAPTRQVPKWVLGLAALLVVAIAGTLFALRSSESPFASAVTACDLGDVSFAAQLRDDDQTLILDHKGAEDLIGLDITDLACILNELEIPSSVIAKMDSTRALDGRQAAEWDGIEASWSYHPDSGMDVILER